MMMPFVNGEYMTDEEFENREANRKKANMSLYDISDRLDDLDNLIYQTIELIGEDDPGLTRDLERVQDLVERAMAEIGERV